MPVETDQQGEVNFDSREKFRLLSGLKTEDLTEAELARRQETKPGQLKQEFAAIVRNSLKPESEQQRTLGHYVVAALESHDPQRYVNARKTLQRELDQCLSEYARRLTSLLGPEKQALFDRRDQLITQIDKLDRIINITYSSLREVMNNYETFVPTGEFYSRLVGFSSEYAFAKACNINKKDIYYSTDDDDRKKKVDWWIKTGRGNKEGKEVIHGIQVKTITIPGMPPSVTIIRNNQDMSEYITKLSEISFSDSKLSQLEQNNYLRKLHDIKSQILTMLQSCDTITSLRHEGKTKPAKVKPVVVIIPGSIARIDVSTGLPADRYIKSLRDALPAILEEQNEQ